MIRLALRVRRADAEVALAELLELAPGGVEEVDLPELDAVEYAVYGAPGELPALPDLRAAAGGALVDVTTSEVADDWAERWREFHRPVEIGGLTVRAPWHAAAGGLEVVVDPAQAFGTGAHPTTRLCLELLLGLEARGSLVDAGCGSGVLAIAASLLGFAPVVALDHDVEAVRAARGNAAVNGVSIDVRRWDLRTDELPRADVVLANLLRPLLLELCARMPEAPPVLVASGLLRAEASEVAGAFADRQGLHERSRLEDGDWAALLLVRE